MSKDDESFSPPHSKPDILATEVVAQSRLFKIEQMQLEFSNGNHRVYERLVGAGHGAVMVVPVDSNGNLLLVSEYACGTHAYEVGFPKGVVDAGETPEQAANRELMEEIGFGAHSLTELKQVTIAPSFLSSKMTIYLASDLYKKTLEGDEPEPLHVVKWPISKWQELLDKPNFNEARCIAALLLAQPKWANDKA